MSEEGSKPVRSSSVTAVHDENACSRVSSERRSALGLRPTSHTRSRIACAISPGLYVVSSPFCPRIASAMSENTDSPMTPVAVPDVAVVAFPAFIPSSAATATAISEGL